MYIYIYIYIYRCFYPAAPRATALDGGGVCRRAPEASDGIDILHMKQIT